MSEARSITPQTARRLAVLKQGLAGPVPPAGAEGVLDVVRRIGCLQLDPISVVARSHLLVLFSRLGPYDPATLDTLLFGERRLFEYWAHCASIVLTDDYPFYRPMMDAYARPDAPSAQRRLAWVEANRALHDMILAELAARGPLPSRAFDGSVSEDWASTGWTSGRNANQMLNFLWLSGRIMVAGRQGQQKLWHLTEQVLPEWTPRRPLSGRELVERATERSLKMLGVARASHIRQHFIRGRYPGLPAALNAMQEQGRIVPVQVTGEGKRWSGPWYMHSEDLPLLDRLEAGDWQPRTTLLSPFDNLICDRARTETLFGFTFRIEIYTPREKRRHGYYVLPILHGDRLVGRLDAAFDRRHKRLTLNAVHAEPDAPDDRDAIASISTAVESLATFLGATDVVYPAGSPSMLSPIPA